VSKVEVAALTGAEPVDSVSTVEVAALTGTESVDSVITLEVAMLTVTEGVVWVSTLELVTEILEDGSTKVEEMSTEEVPPIQLTYSVWQVYGAAATVESELAAR